MKISVCIPAYNRADVLPELLDSILNQAGEGFEIVIAEDDSPQREVIGKVVTYYQSKFPGVIRYYENESNLGFDGNLRRLFELAQGEYCLFMGNDDLMCPNAIATVASALTRHNNVGVIMRSYAQFEQTSENINQVFRYFPGERFFPAGLDTIVTFYRRMVVIPGIVLHRKTALRYATERFDGSLLYQLHLVSNILTEMNGVFLPEILVLYRSGGVPDFGNSAVECNKFVPGAQTPLSSLHFMRGMLQIARALEADRQLPVYTPILRDLSNYSYPFISIQRKQPLPIFLRYCVSLAQIGFGRYPLFYLYVLALLLFGEERLGLIILWIKQRIGYTPTLGKLYRGTPV